MADPGQQPGGPAADGRANLSVLQADLASLLKGDVVVLGQPGQAGDRDVVALIDGKAKARSTSRSTLDGTAGCWDSPLVTEGP
jgi:hypothetical protein